MTCLRVVGLAIERRSIAQEYKALRAQRAVADLYEHRRIDLKSQDLDRRHYEAWGEAGR